MTEPTTKAAPYKQKVVKEFTQLIDEYPIIGAINMENLPAQQLQTIREKLRETVVIKMTKRRLLKLAFKQAKKENIDKLSEHLGGMPALMFTKDNPFTVYKTIKKNKSPAPAKGGQKAPKDIVVPAGPTPFAPGPIIGELGMYKIKTKVEGGKIAVQEDTVVCKEGEEIAPKLAELLTRLNIKPMEIGLDVRALFENGDILPRSVLDIDEDEYLANITQAAQWAFNLSVEAAIPVEENKELLIQKAFREAKAIALEAGHASKDVIEDLVAKAEQQASALKQEVKE